MKQFQKKGFTMVEVIIVLVIISTSLITIIGGVSTTMRYVSEMRQRTIALNLAKEGIEAVYNIRNTNWRRWSANRDACWLKANPMVDEENDGCENDSWFSTRQRYSILSTGEQSKFFYLKQITSNNFSNTPGSKGFFDSPGERVKDNEGFVRQLGFFSTAMTRIPQDHYNISPRDSHRYYAMHSVNGEWLDHNSFANLPSEEQQKENTTLGRYRRFMSGGGLYSKESGNLLECENGLKTKCSDDTAKEYLFCSTVIYTAPYQGFVNICAIMTNYLE